MYSVQVHPLHNTCPHIDYSYCLILSPLKYLWHFLVLTRAQIYTNIWFWIASRVIFTVIYTIFSKMSVCVFFVEEFMFYLYSLFIHIYPEERVFIMFNNFIMSPSWNTSALFNYSCLLVVPANKTSTWNSILNIFALNIIRIFDYS